MWGAGNNIEISKIKCLEIVLTPGKLLYIPAYWWYTFKFDDENTSVSCFKYRTYMNNIAISPNIFMYALQNQNVECKIVKNLDTNVVTNVVASKETNTETTSETTSETTLIDDLKINDNLPQTVMQNTA